MTFINHELIKKNSIEARPYQEVLVARTIEKGNTLVVAPTALGKTIVAVLLTAHKLKENPKGKVLFLAPTKPLVLQHEKSFKKFLEIDEKEIVSVTGTINAEKRKKIYEESKIINATPQTIENDLLQGKINLKNFDLVIFDEAHKASKEYSYVFINLQLQKQNKDSLVLALTASPGSNDEKIQDVCKNLSIKNIEIKNSGDDDVKEYVNDIEIDWIKLDFPESFKEIKYLLEKFQTEQIIALKNLHIAITTNKKYYNRIRILEMQRMISSRLRNGKNPSLFVAASKCAALLKIAHAEELIETQGIGSLRNYFNKIKDDAKKEKSKAAKQIAQHKTIKDAIELTEKLFKKRIQHPKYEELKKIILEELRKNRNSKILIFNHYRDSITEVVKFLETEKEIKIRKFIGQATKGKDKGMNQKEQQRVIEELKEGKYNVLVMSSVGEEGLDIPAVEMVVFFEPVPSEIRTIQRRGRTGRFGKGKNVILMTKGTRDEAFYWAAKAKEKRMQSTLAKMKGTQLKEQSTLANFVETNEKNEIVIFVDNREHASSVTKTLFDKTKIVMKQLTVGDYVLSKDVCVERKTIEDFLSSMLDGRLFNQLIDLRENYSKPLILLEGNINEIFSLRNIHKNSIIGALTSIALDYNVPILNTKNAEETAEYLYVIAKREQIGEKKEIRLRIGRKGLSTKEQQQFIIESLPLVGPTLAKNLLLEFGSIKNIVNANEKELQEVDNLGKLKAKKIKKIIEEKFDEMKDTE